MPRYLPRTANDPSLAVAIEVTASSPVENPIPTTLLPGTHVEATHASPTAHGEQPPQWSGSVALRVSQPDATVQSL